ncbi:hypothetical protein ACFPM0_33920 [Pseudonocardia sulfidoxydans]
MTVPFGMGTRAAARAGARRRAAGVVPPATRAGGLRGARARTREWAGR